MSATAFFAKIFLILICLISPAFAADDSQKSQTERNREEILRIIVEGARRNEETWRKIEEERQEKDARAQGAAGQPLPAYKPYQETQYYVPTKSQSSPEDASKSQARRNQEEILRYYQNQNLQQQRSDREQEEHNRRVRDAYNQGVTEKPYVSTSPSASSSSSSNDSSSSGTWDSSRSSSATTPSTIAPPMPTPYKTQLVARENFLRRNKIDVKIDSALIHAPTTWSARYQRWSAKKAHQPRISSEALRVAFPKKMPSLKYVYGVGQSEVRDVALNLEILTQRIYELGLPFASAGKALNTDLVLLAKLNSATANYVDRVNVDASLNGNLYDLYFLESQMDLAEKVWGQSSPELYQDFSALRFYVSSLLYVYRMGAGVN